MRGLGGAATVQSVHASLRLGGKHGSVTTWLGVNTPGCHHVYASSRQRDVIFSYEAFDMESFDRGGKRDRIAT